MSGGAVSAKGRRRPSTLAIIVLAVFALLAVNIAVVPMIRGFIAERRVAQEIIANLYSTPAGTPPTHERYGATIRPADGSWIVVDYRDTHDGTAPFDIAYALCSDGTWLVSDEHHCGKFGWIHASIAELAQLNADAVNPDYAHWRDQFVAECRARGEHDLVFPATLEDAKRALESLEKRFVEIPPPARP